MKQINNIFKTKYRSKNLKARFKVDYKPTLMIYSVDNIYEDDYNFYYNLVIKKYKTFENYSNNITNLIYIWRSNFMIQTHYHFS